MPIKMSVLKPAGDLLGNDNNLILYPKKKNCPKTYIFHKYAWLALGGFMDSDSDLEPCGKGF